MPRNPFAATLAEEFPETGAPWGDVARLLDAANDAVGDGTGTGDGGIDVDVDVPTLDDLAPNLDPESGTTRIELPDHGVIIDLNPGSFNAETDASDHDANLAEVLDEGILNRIAEELLEGIEADDDSRQDWLNARKKGIELLGMKVEATRSTPDAGGTIEGLSTVRHPLLQEAVLRFQANA